MHVAIVGLMHESNTFIASTSVREHFQSETLLSGEAIRSHFADGHHEVAGFFEGLSHAGMEAVPIFFARALPYGTIAEDTYRQLRTEMLDKLSAAGHLDAVLVACHGADVAEQTRDADGDWLAAIRNYLGHDIPIIATLDPHANLTPQMVQATDALIAYRTNPHEDQRERGVEAARLMARTLSGKVRPTQAAVFPPLVINLERQATALSPLAEHFRDADTMLAENRVLSNSILLGFPYADVEAMGCSAVVVTDDAPDKAESRVLEIGQRLWHDREEFLGKLIAIDEALSRAEQVEGTTCLLDMGDNVGGGSPADGTHLIHAIHKRGLGRSFACIFDPESVRAAESAGTGEKIELAIGGKSDSLHGEPLRAICNVFGLRDGRFEEPQPRHGGFSEFDQGRTAVVQTESGLTLMLTSKRMAPFSLRQLTAFGVEPRDFRIVVAKGVHAPVAAYRDVCGEFIRVNTPGVTTADLSRLEFRHRRRPLFPLEKDFAWTPVIVHGH